MRIFLLMFSISLSTFGQIKPASSFFPQAKTKVLIVGTFHFDYPNLDVLKTIDSNKIDVLKEPKKSELSELVNYIRKFKPNKIAIEARPNWNASEKMNRYKKGEFRENRDERFQIGMRLANELNLDTIFSIDTESMDNDLLKLDSLYIKNLFKDFDFNSNDPFETMVNKWLDYEETLPAKTTLLEYFKHINSRESHRLNYGAYLIGDFKLDDTRGADILSVWWYNRNLRMFRKLQQITESHEDRILVIVGNGHASILRHLFESSPEYEFVEFDNF